MTIEAITEEAKKCDIMCFNCHTAYHRKYPVNIRRPATEAKKLARIGSCIARGQHLKESLSQLPPDLLKKIHSIITTILPKEPKQKEQYLIPIHRK
jgi:hypothetical protein